VDNGREKSTGVDWAGGERGFVWKMNLNDH